VQLANSAALIDFLKQVQEQDPESGIAVYGDASAAYGRIIDVLNLGAENNLKMVLATTPRPMPTSSETDQTTTTTEQ
jgi:biopolymer transport protein ExbD